MNYQTFKKNWKRYAWSSLITFITAFLIVVAPEINKLSIADLSNGTLIGLGFIAIRAGVKALVEFLLSILVKK